MNKIRKLHNDGPSCGCGTVTSCSSLSNLKIKIKRGTALAEGVRRPVLEGGRRALIS